MELLPAPEDITTCLLGGSFVKLLFFICCTAPAGAICSVAGDIFKYQPRTTPASANMPPKPAAHSIFGKFISAWSFARCLLISRSMTLDFGESFSDDASSEASSVNDIAFNFLSSGIPWNPLVKISSSFTEDILLSGPNASDKATD